MSFFADEQIKQCAGVLRKDRCLVYKAATSIKEKDSQSNIGSFDESLNFFSRGFPRNDAIEILHRIRMLAQMFSDLGSHERGFDLQF